MDRPPRPRTRVRWALLDGHGAELEVGVAELGSHPRTCHGSSQVDLDRGDLRIRATEAAHDQLRTTSARSCADRIETAGGSACSSARSPEPDSSEAGGSAAWGSGAPGGGNGPNQGTVSAPESGWRTCPPASVTAPPPSHPVRCCEPSQHTARGHSFGLGAGAGRHPDGTSQRSPQPAANRPKPHALCRSGRAGRKSVPAELEPLPARLE